MQQDGEAVVRISLKRHRTGVILSLDFNAQILGERVNVFLELHLIAFSFGLVMPAPSMDPGCEFMPCFVRLIIFESQ